MFWIKKKKDQDKWFLFLVEKFWWEQIIESPRKHVILNTHIMARTIIEMSLYNWIMYDWLLIFFEKSMNRIYYATGLFHGRNKVTIITCIDKIIEIIMFYVIFGSLTLCAIFFTVNRCVYSFIHPEKWVTRDFIFLANFLH